MLSASKPLAPSWYLLSTQRPHYLKIGRRIINPGANLQRQLVCRQSTHYATPARQSAAARHISRINLSRSAHDLETSTRHLNPETDDKMVDFEAVLKAKYPAKAHARRVIEYIRKKSPHASGTLYLEGQKTRMIEDNDEPMPFR